MSIVKTDINYTYEIMMSNIYELNNKFSFLQVQNAVEVLKKFFIQVVFMQMNVSQVFYL